MNQSKTMQAECPDIGMKFGNLIIEKITVPSRGRGFSCVCRCSCGNYHKIKWYSLKNGFSGCCPVNKIDLVGSQFNDLTVISKTNKRTKQQGVLWECRCKCGKIVFIDTYTLRSLKIKGCGCIAKTKSNKYIGKQYGLLMIKDLFYKNKICFANCLCQCGNTKAIRLRNILQNSTVSCGCYFDTYVKSSRNRGESNPSWKGGVTSFTNRLRNCKKSKLWSCSVLERDMYTCFFCKNPGGKLHVHHKKPLSNILQKNNIKTMDDALSCSELWDINNGVTLCAACHIRLHKNKNTVAWKPWGAELFLNLNDKYCYKKIFINNGCQTSLQYHLYKIETNYLERGTAVLEIGDNINNLDKIAMSEGDYVTIFPKTIHRITAKSDIILLESSSPEINDVIRISDNAGRGDGRIESEYVKY